MNEELHVNQIVNGQDLTQHTEVHYPQMNMIPTESFKLTLGKPALVLDLLKMMNANQGSNRCQYFSL